jgi:hypothetical protein
VQGANEGAQAAGSMPGAGPTASGDNAGDPALVITSCPGCTFTVTRAMLEGAPRLDLERIYSALLQHMQNVAMQYREARTCPCTRAAPQRDGAVWRTPRTLREEPL